MELIWYGTASIKLKIGDERLLFDPFFRMNKHLESARLEDFCDCDYIFNTHAHFDHLCDVPKILPHTKACVYGTSTTEDRLSAQNVSTKRVYALIEGCEFATKNATIKPIKSLHVKNDLPVIIKTTIWGLLRLKFKSASIILGLHNDFRMGPDIYAFDIEAEGKKILLFGSAGMHPQGDYPKNVDVLIWPYQGRSDILKYSLPIIEKLSPKKIVLDHFDDAFPPITGKVNIKKFVKKMGQLHPEIEVIVPTFKQVIKL